MIQYIDAREAVAHAYAIRARAESLRGTLGDKTPGGDWSQQEWQVHACYVIKGMQHAAHGPYRRAIEARYTHDDIERDRAVALLAPRIKCPSRAFNAYSLMRWATGDNTRQDWDFWTGITHKSRRTLRRWQKDTMEQARNFMDLGFRMTTDHFRECGICEARDVA